MNASLAFSADQKRLLQQLLQESILLTEAKMAELGMEPGQLLEPEEAHNKQILLLRHAFLQGEKSALHFEPTDLNHWRVLRACLQPIIVAYQAHERFVQSVILGTDPKDDEALMSIYRDRLQNSERFREIFFDLKERLQNSEGMQAATVHEPVKPTYRTQDDAAAIQKNVLTQLEKELRRLEKLNKEQHNTILSQSDELAAAKIENDRLQQQVAKLEKEVERLREEAVNFRLAADAAKRGVTTELIEVPVEITGVPATVSTPLAG